MGAVPREARRIGDEVVVNRPALRAAPPGAHLAQAITGNPPGGIKQRPAIEVVLDKGESQGAVRIEWTVIKRNTNLVGVPGRSARRPLDLVELVVEAAEGRPHPVVAAAVVDGNKNLERSRP